MNTMSDSLLEIVDSVMLKFDETYGTDYQNNTFRILLQDTCIAILYGFSLDKCLHIERKLDICISHDSLRRACITLLEEWLSSRDNFECKWLAGFISEDDYQFSIHELKMGLLGSILDTV